VVFSYSQIAHYLRCPRSYRYRYLDGWLEKETRAAMIFGRCFETALAASFLGHDCSATLFEEWSAYRDAGLGFKSGENWHRLYHQGIRLLELFARDGRIDNAKEAKGGRVKGAAGGAAVGAIADDDAGTGPAAGATAGAVVGGAKQRRANKAAKQQAAQATAQQQQQQEA
jgi:hypothetical protein